MQSDKPGQGRTGAALYITPGSSTFYAYGSSSMVQPVLETTGLTNSFGTETTRVFDMTMESLLKANPEWIILLSGEATDEQARQTFLGFPGAKDLRAVADGHIVALPFALTDPPSTLSVDGVRELAKALGKQ